MVKFNPEQVIEEFQKRRRRMLQSFAICLALIAVSLIAIQIADMNSDFLGISKKGWYSLAVSQLIAGILIALTGFRQYKCPACNEIVRAHDKYYLGVAIDPRKCPNCGSRLDTE